MLDADGTVETITGTTIHPVWSVDRQEWLPLAELADGENLQGLDGLAVVLSVSLSRVSQPVYNIEVHGEHVYQVGELGLVVHNECPSFASLKRALGLAGERRHWHHIVEQSKLAQFGANAIHNTDNVVSVADDVHYKITGFYNSIQDFTDGQTVRQWLNGRTFEFQYEFGMDILRKFGAK